MVNPKFSPEIYGQIDSYLEQGWSFSVIQKHLKKRGLNISKGQISKIKNRDKENVHPRENRCPPGPKATLDSRQLSRLRQMALKPNPPPLKEMADRLNSTVRITQYALAKKIKVRRVKKPKGHFLTDEKKEKRRVRAWPFYLELKCEQWKNVITSDEAWFYLSPETGQTEHQYLLPDQTIKDCEVRTHQAHQKGVMVWAAISYRGSMGPIFVEPGAKINQDYYIEAILTPMIKWYWKLYPDGDGVFHQDSAPAHTGQKTLAFLRSNNIKFITPDRWLPNSPDLAPCDFFLWSYLKTQVNKRKVTTIGGLQRVIKEELQKIPQDTINRALESWPRRVRQCYIANGGHIENRK